MYLPNPDVRAVGFEAAEFLDAPKMAEVALPTPASAAEEAADVDPSTGHGGSSE
jgi:hypothetical protein